MALLLIVAGSASRPLGAQPRGSTDVTGRLDALYFGGRPEAVLSVADSALKRDSTAVPVLWRAARAAIALGCLAPEQSSDNADYQRAERYARLAIDAAPNEAAGHIWLAASLGRRAIFADVLGTARLGEGAYRAVQRALALDSTSAYGHDILGKIHLEVRSLSSFYRWLGEHVLGVSAARGASYVEAERHLRRAIALDPEMILFRLDLAKLLLQTGRHLDAEHVLYEASRLSPRHPQDQKLREDVLNRLSQLGKARAVRDTP